ncbi:MAG: hypothetical protein RL758_1820 [Pseudomonadota bacterium]|jgi:Protein of unknown function (DUF3429)
MSESRQAAAVLIQRLGHLGLVPFIVLAVLLWLVREPQQAAWLSIAIVGYAACVASFLGAVHWGAAFSLGTAARPEHLATQKRHILWGVLPSILSWVALLMPAYAGLPLMGLVLLACYLVDRQLYPSAWRPWLTLRFRLTVVAVIACLVGAAGI